MPIHPMLVLLLQVLNSRPGEMENSKLKLFNCVLGRLMGTPTE